MRTQIGRYRIEKTPLGEGGMGIVYKGIHEGLQRQAAIKALPHGSGPDVRIRLRREAQAQARLQHPNIVAVYDLIEEGDELFIAMECVDGQTLDAILEERASGRMPLSEALRLFVQVLAALDYVHGHGIIHRDIKPSNVMVAGDQVKLTDFGIALTAGIPRLTAPANGWGTWQYMSPEQFRPNDSIDHRSDIYSAGLVLYRMLAGRPAFAEQEYFAQVQARLYGPPDLRTLIPELPAGVSDALNVALRPEARDRHPSAKAFADALQEGRLGFLPVQPEASNAVFETPMATLPQPLPVDPNAVTVPIHQAPHHKVRSTVSWIVIGSSLVATYALWRAAYQPLPAGPPTGKKIVRTATSPPVPEPATATMPAYRATTVPVRNGPEAGEPNDGGLPGKVPVDDERQIEEKRLRELRGLREAVAAALTGVPSLIYDRQFDEADQELERIARLIERNPAEFRQQQDELRDLRSELNRLMVAEATESARQTLETAAWEERLRLIDGHLAAGRFPEAQSMAKGVLDDPKTPPTVRSRTQRLLERAQSELKNVFKDVRPGPTTNTIRKPPTPPGH